MKKYTRIELRFFGKDVPLETYADYIETTNKDVGKIFKSLFFSRDRVREIAARKRISPDRIEAFLNMVERDGLHYAREAFNENRNFYRTIEPILKKAGRTLDFSARWKKKVQEDIIGDFDIVAFFKGHQT